jgi:hypothetical protein
MRSANPELTLLKALFAVTSNGEGAQGGCIPANAPRNPRPNQTRALAGLGIKARGA